MFNIGSYYLIDTETNKAIAGPAESRAIVALIIAKGPVKIQARYYNASRYYLAKIGLYPKTKAGDQRLAEDLAAAAGGAHG